MAIENISDKIKEEIIKNKKIADSLTPLSIEIDKDVIYFINPDHPNKKYSISKSQIRDIFSSL